MRLQALNKESEVMPTHQIEEYYLYINNITVSDEQKEEIEILLSDEMFADYEFQDGNTCLVVDGVQNESEGDELEDKIMAIIKD